METTKIKRVSKFKQKTCQGYGCDPHPALRLLNNAYCQKCYGRKYVAEHKEQSIASQKKSQLARKEILRQRAVKYRAKQKAQAEADKANAAPTPPNLKKGVRCSRIFINIESGIILARLGKENHK